MPNWCECDLYIQGASARIDEFLRLVKGEESNFDFDRLIPYPEHFKKLDQVAAEWDKLHPLPRTGESWKERPKDGYNQGGYEWCIKNWGTKWPPKCAEVSRSALELVEISFATAWSPPTPVIQRAAELFPELRFELRYFECGSMFNGMFACEHGTVVTDESGVYYGNRGG
jgi:hypothetical protein